MEGACFGQRRSRRAVACLVLALLLHPATAGGQLSDGEIAVPALRPARHAGDHRDARQSPSRAATTRPRVATRARLPIGLLRERSARRVGRHRRGSFSEHPTHKTTRLIRGRELPDEGADRARTTTTPRRVRRGDVFNGATDNAVGVAGRGRVVGRAIRSLSSTAAPVAAGRDAEEDLLAHRWAGAPAIPIERTVGYVNPDYPGRTRRSRASVIAVGRRDRRRSPVRHRRRCRARRVSAVPARRRDPAGESSFASCAATTRPSSAGSSDGVLQRLDRRLLHRVRDETRLWISEKLACRADPHRLLHDDHPAEGPTRRRSSR